MLRDFVSSNQKQTAKIGGHNIAPIDSDFDKGLSIYLINANSQTGTALEGEPLYAEKYLIHCIDSCFTDHKPYIFNNLLREHEIFSNLKIDTLENEEIIFFYENEHGAHNATILPTPINFNRYFDSQKSLDDSRKTL